MDSQTSLDGVDVLSVEDLLFDELFFSEAV
jgi:hypothetical protein